MFFNLRLRLIAWLLLPLTLTSCESMVADFWDGRLNRPPPEFYRQLASHQELLQQEVASLRAPQQFQLRQDNKLICADQLKKTALAPTDEGYTQLYADCMTARGTAPLQTYYAKMIELELLEPPQKQQLRAVNKSFCKDYLARKGVGEGHARLFVPLYTECMQARGTAPLTQYE